MFGLFFLVFSGPIFWITLALMLYIFYKSILNGNKIRTVLYVGLLVLTLILFAYYNSTSFAPIILALVLTEMLVFTSYKSYKDEKIRRRKLTASNIQDIDRMNGYYFESYLKELFKALGFKVIKTPSSGDYGADLIVEKKGAKIAIQAKRYTGNVGIKAVQEIQSAMLYYETDEAWVVTNSAYTQSAIKLANKTKVRLIDREQLINLIIEAKENNQECMLQPS
ncbi:restriction endonuclease [Alkalihalobacillus sp. NPDC078783]